VAAEPDSDIAQRYGSVARQVIEQLAALDDNSGPEIVFD
jgi:ATP-binding protein involved in chromosome partitioning